MTTAIANTRRTARRAGNALVLVTAILVLLVIIATAFLVRSRSVRAQAAATQLAAGREARVESVVGDLAQGVADALFVRPIDPSTYEAQVSANQATNAAVPGLGLHFARSDFPRLPPDQFAVRYGVDMFDGHTAGFDNRFLAPYANPQDRLQGKVDGYNYAPFSVIPFTNWPVRYGAVDGESDFRLWFTAPLADPSQVPPAPYPTNYLIATNPRGNPGFGDSRWLASTEPMRAEVTGIDVPGSTAVRARAFPLVLETQGAGAAPAAKITPEGLGFSHWPHLSWIATANNGFRVCWDISDLDQNTLTGAAGTAAGEFALGTPYEQWLPWIAPAELAPVTGWTHPRGYLAFGWKDFRWRWARWFNRQVPAAALGLGRPTDPLAPLADFSAVPGHAQVIKGVTAQGAASPVARFQAPPNFLQMAAYGDPSDEFKVYTQADSDAGLLPPGFAIGDPKLRNLIGRTLADADGDGWTDSLWFVSPTSADRGTRQVVAVRIMDNSGLLNVNAATRFERSNTVGQTPSDVALVTRRESYDLTTDAGRRAAAFDVPVGFLSAPENDPEWRTADPGDRLAVLPVRKATLPSVDDPYGSAGWSLLNAQYPSGSAASLGGNYRAVYRTSTAQALEVAFAPDRFEGRRNRGGADDGNSTVNTQPLAGYFARPTLLGQLGVIREGRIGTGASKNALVPDFAFGDDEIGAPGDGDFFALTRQPDRATYFKAMQNDGAIVDPVTSYRRAELTPFGMDDELELRAFNGCNDPQTVSRLEAALGWSFATESGESRPLDQFLRSTRSREETTRFLPPLDPRLADSGVRSLAASGGIVANQMAPRSGTELVLDHRRKLTTVSGARNEMLPPRLWTVKNHTLGEPARSLNAVSAFDAAYDGQTGVALDPPYYPSRMFPGVPPAQIAFPFDQLTAADFLTARQRFINDNRKIDLRRPVDETVPRDNPQTLNQDERDNAITASTQELSWDLQRVLRTALLDNSMRASGQPADSHFGRPGANSTERTWADGWTKALAASYAANLLTYRDAAKPVPVWPNQPAIVTDQPLFPSQRTAVPWPSDAPVPSAIAGVSANNLGFIGIEAHPVIKEVFVAVVYPPNPISPDEAEEAWDDMPNPPDPLPPCPIGDGELPDDRRLPAPGNPGSAWPANVTYPQGGGLFNASCDWSDSGEFGVDGGAPAIVFVAQIANPFNVPVKLGDYELRVNGAGGSQGFQFRASDSWAEQADQNDLSWGNTYGPDVELGPCTPEEPRTAIVFAIPETFPNGQRFPREEWLDFFDLGVSVDTDGDGTADIDDLSTGANSPYPRPGGVAFFPAGRWFKPDHAALFAPAWFDGPNQTPLARGATLLFDATLPLTDSAGTLRNRSTSLVGAGLQTRASSASVMRLWTPRPPASSPGNRSYVELVRRIDNPLSSNVQQAAEVVVDRFENQVDPASDIVSFAGGSGSSAVNADNFLSLAARTIPDPDQPEVTARVSPPATRVAFRRQSAGGTDQFIMEVDGTRYIDQDIPVAERDAGRSVPGNYLVNWVRGARQWLYDVDGDGYLASDERTPRFAFSRTAGVMGVAASNSSVGARELQTPTLVGNVEQVQQRGAVLGSRLAPDTPTGAAWRDFQVAYWSSWNRQIRGSKPTFLSSRTFDDGSSRLYPRPAGNDTNDDWWSSFPTGLGTVTYGEKGVTDPRLVAPGSVNNFVAPLRLFQKDRDFDQVAEILDVPMWGPLVQLSNSGLARRTYVTLPEILAMPQNVQPGATAAPSGASPPYPQYSLLFPMFARSALSNPQLTGSAPRYGTWQQQVSWNRLSIEPAVSTPLLAAEAQALATATSPPVSTQLWGNQVLPSAFSAPGQVPPPQQNGVGFNARLPGVVALLDAFTLDDRGAALLDDNGDGSISPTELGIAEDRRLRLAGGFSGQRTHGLVNINTAPVEVLRALPHMTRLSYFDDFPVRVTAESNPSDLDDTATELGKARLVREDRFWERSPAERAVLDQGTTGNATPYPTVRVASGIESYRNKLNPVNGATGNWTYPDSPSYVDRGLQLGPTGRHNEFAPAMRVERGFESVGELGLLVRGASGTRGSGDVNANTTPDVREIAQGPSVDMNRNGVPDPTTPLSGTFGTFDADAATNWGNAMSWSIRYAGMDPFRVDWASDRNGLGARSQDIAADAGFPPFYTQGVPLADGDGKEFTIGGRTAIDDHLLTVATDDISTVNAVETDDVTTAPTETRVLRFDRTSGDALEQNQLLRGLSSIVTTRSDVFTMWVRVRTIRQDPLTGKWNATDPDSIVDEARYVLTIDRSNVDRPGDAPRILGMVKVPK